MAKYMRSWRVEREISRELDRIAEEEGTTTTEIASRFLAKGIEDRKQLRRSSIMMLYAGVYMTLGGLAVLFKGFGLV